MIFSSFFMGGFECADHINRSGERVNLLKETGHDVRAGEDYANLAALGIKTVREGICWSSVETAPYVFDFSEVAQRITAAEEHSVLQVWDLCHFGYPDGLYPTHPHFCARFTALCSAFTEFHKRHARQPLFVVPINEISFLSWHSGDVRGTVPFAVNSGFDIKYHLCKAAILGLKALKEADPHCRVLWVEPLVCIHPGEETDLELIHNLNENQFQAMDIIAGRMCPELGGKEEYLDVIGLNYYWDCQWVHNGGPLPWPETEPGRKPLSQLLKKAAARYNKPVFLSETGHFGQGRAQWLQEVTSECITAMEEGLNLQGVCIYPVTDRPDWDNLDRYSNCGIWDLDADKNRIPCPFTVQAVTECTEAVNYHFEAASQRTIVPEAAALGLEFEMLNKNSYEIR